ncbi:MAG: riboflavin synthase [Candidatus Taylorbacteria bacterium]|nr:riboflavin synthase [Candidatus Taylorbacteria bacterium]
MFTGIIRKTAKVKKAVDMSGRFEVANPLLTVKGGDSIAVNGVCSTVVKAGKTLVFEYMPETLERSTVGKLLVGELVNLELSLRASDRLDGHIVLGHVDTVGTITDIRTEGNSRVFSIAPNEPKRFMKWVAEKGSITIDGVSLTVVTVSAKQFEVKIIPYTMGHTAFAERRVGSLVNVEFDILAKYVERLCT